MRKADNIKLNMLGFPAIQTASDFSAHTHISKYTIYQLSYRAEMYYRTYHIRKKSGKQRLICQPTKKLKGLQSWILYNILNKVKASNSCTGFERGTSTLDNAKPHRGANCILSIDLQDFFSSIGRDRVFNIFRSIGYNNLISTIFTNICTYDGKLPQGGPCSPKLANLAAWTLDKRIQGYVGKRGITYTRYADDLTFSGLSPGKVVHIIPMIKEIIESESLRINDAKTRIAGAARRKSVTGLVISGDNIGIGKREYKRLRARLHQLALLPTSADEKLLCEARGWLSYLNSVDKPRMLRAHDYLRQLAKAYPDSMVTRLSAAVAL